MLWVWQATEGLKPAVINRLAKELRELQQRPEEGIRVRLAGRAYLKAGCRSQILYLSTAPASDAGDRQRG